MTMETDQLVTVVIPAYNEAGAIGRLLDSLLDQDFPRDLLEVIVVDGGSTDRTKMIAQDYQKRFSRLLILDNHKKIAPAALNLGIKQARGGVIIRLDAHSFVPSDFVRKNMEVLSKTEAGLVGGPIKTVGRGYLGGAIALVLSSPFGVGDSYFRFSQKARYVDTLAFGAYRRRVFDQVGLFNEQLVRNQDIEFSRRMRWAGEKIWLTPEISSSYQCPSSLVAFIRQSWANGYWNILAGRLAGQVLSRRHFIPLLFAAALALSLVLSPFFYFARLSLLAVLACYFAAAVIFSLVSVRPDKWVYLAVLPEMFFIFHLSYGLGSLSGFYLRRK